ncbi:MAG: type II toxin-antitoxin system RelE/ParE family toxin [Pseudomonadota bacterium]
MSNDKIITFYETKQFYKKAIKLLGLKLLDELKFYLADNPKSGDVISGGNGVRKLRWSLPNKGKRGGVRVIYFYFDEKGLVSLLTIYAKNEKENLDKSELKDIVNIVDLIRKNI